MGIVDAQSVKNTDTAREKGYDAGKRVSGIKRHIVVDTNGLPHALAVTTADVTDRNGAILAFQANKKHLKKVKKILADGGYSGEPFAGQVEKILKAELNASLQMMVLAFVRVLLGRVGREKDLR